MQAEPLNSGLTTISLSPGVTVGVGRSSTIYVYVQVPVYQRVKGIQLVPRSLFPVGWTGDFQPVAAGVPWLELDLHPG